MPLLDKYYPKCQRKKIKALKANFEAACNDMVQEFCIKQKLEFDGWIAGEVGGVASFINEYYFGLMDIVLDITTKQPKGLILQWQDDGVEWAFNTPSRERQLINYKSYTLGLRYHQLPEGNL